MTTALIWAAILVAFILGSAALADPSKDDAARARIRAAQEIATLAPAPPPAANPGLSPAERIMGPSQDWKQTLHDRQQDEAIRCLSQGRTYTPILGCS